MRRALWNGLAACVAIVALLASPAALAAKKKTPTPAAGASSATTAADKAAKTEKVNLNTADEKAIAGAKGVGDKLAKELVKNRPYKTWEEVSKVKGVGSGKKLDSLKKVLKLTEGIATKDEATSASSSPSKKSSSSSSEKLAPGTKININTASAEELDKLPEIGPVKAQAIVEYRKANGPFKSAEDIEKVKGIKEGTFAKIKDFIVVK